MKNKVLKGALALILVLAALDLYLIIDNSMSRRVVFRRHKLSAIVRLVLDGHTFCSGTVIAPNAIITAAHCVLVENTFTAPTTRKNIEIRPASNRSIKNIAQVSAVRYQMDQAVLEGDFSQFEVAPYIPEVPKLDSKELKNSKMTACGFPLGGPLYCTTIYFKDMAQFAWKVKGTLIPGMSGGPVFLSNGAVVATNCAVEGPDSIIQPIYNLNYELPQE